MAKRPWRRMREQAVDARTTIQPDRANPWDDDTAPPRLGDLGMPTAGVPTTANPSADAADGTARAEQYAAWAERMRSKRERTRALVGKGAEADAGAPGGGAHWSTDALYAESRHVEEQETLSRPNPWRTRELLSTLDLDGEPTLDEIGAAYRRLAKTHHPDRFVGADTATQEYHAKRMLDINAAYSSLKALHGAER